VARHIIGFGKVRIRLAGICIVFFQCFASTQSAELADLIDKIEPSVVRIDVEGVAKGIGSGFVISRNGIVVTNHHVIAGAREAAVTFSSGETAKVIGTIILDSKRDIALLKIDKLNLPTLQIAEALPRKGEQVAAFGAPQGLSFSASEGIVSAVRTGKDLSEYADELDGTWVQTTAPISAGNSGGPLVNSAGQVVGVNTMAIVSGQNLNFAISSIDVRAAVKESEGRNTTPLSEGAAIAKRIQRAKISGNEILPSKIPASSLTDFVEKGKVGLKTAADELRKKLGEAKERLRAVETARISATAKRRRTGFGYGSSTPLRVRGQLVYSFPTMAAKQTALKEAREQVSNLTDVLEKIENPENGLLNFLTLVGPRLDPGAVGNVGHVPEIEVSQIADEQEFHAYIGSQRVAVRGIPTTHLANESTVRGGLMYVSGTETYQTRLGSNTIFVLRQLPEKALENHLAVTTSMQQGENLTQLKGGSKSSPVYRTWSDKTGAYKVEAAFVTRVDDHVILKRQDGKIITVPVATFSKADQDYLEKAREVAAQ
jgi:hypothetical protein